jgi:hypothetical protein
MRNQRFLRRGAASQYLDEIWGVIRAPSTLAKYAVIGGGPVFRRDSRFPLYSPDDLDAWAASRLSAPMRSTSDAASPKAETTHSPTQPDAGGDQQDDDNGERARRTQRTPSTLGGTND